MKIAGLIMAITFSVLLTACGSSCDQQEFTEKMQQVQQKMFQLDNAGQIAEKGTQFVEMMAKLEGVKNVTGDDLGEACAILDELLYELD